MRNDCRNGSGYDAQDLYRTPLEAAKILEEVARLIELAGDNPPREVMNHKEAADFLRLS